MNEKNLSETIIEQDATNYAPKPMTPLQEFWFYFKKNKGAVVGLIYILLVVFLAIFADFVAPHLPSEQFRDSLLAPPVWMEGGSWQFILGTDDVGRDIFPSKNF